MSTPISFNSAPTNNSPAKTDARSASADKAPTPHNQRAELGANIMQASLDVSISSGNNSMALLYRSAIDSINEHLEPSFGPDAIQAAMQQDNSAAATADRILSQSTAFFDAYARQHPDKEPEQLIEDFVSTIRSGFEQGYAEAVEILSGLGVMEQDSPIAAEISQTYQLVQQGYDDFLQTKLAELQTQEPKEDTPE